MPIVTMAFLGMLFGQASATGPGRSEDRGSTIATGSQGTVTFSATSPLPLVPSRVKVLRRWPSPAAVSPEPAPLVPEKGRERGVECTLRVWHVDTAFDAAFVRPVGEGVDPGMVRARDCAR